MGDTTVAATPLLVSPTPAAVTCGYAGGCVMAIDAVGLEANILNGLSTVKVGGVECELVDSMAVGCATDMNRVCCRVPPMQTKTSLSQFEISGDGEIGSDNPNSNYVDTLPGPAGPTSECAFRSTEGTWNYVNIGPPSFPVNSAYKAVLKEFKFYIGSFTKPKSHYEGNLRLQGSSDGFVTTPIDEPMTGVHEGWNYFENTGLQYPELSQFRFISSEVDGCLDIATVAPFHPVFTGQELVDDA
jgi:hypothetical protein